MSKVNLEQQYKEDLANSVANAMFSDKDDEMLGERKNGYYSKTEDVNGRKYLCHIFDNGHCYYMNPNTKKLMQYTELRPDLFLHKYVETYVANFILANNLTAEISATPNVEFEAVTLENDEKTYLSIGLDREENEMIVEDIELPNVELERKMMEGIYRLCKFCSFKMFIADGTPALLDFLKANGATADEEDELLEITDATKFA